MGPSWIGAELDEDDAMAMAVDVSRKKTL